MEALGLLLLVAFAVWVVYKLGLFRPVVHLADSAQLASAQYRREVNRKIVKKNREEHISMEDMEKAMINMAMEDQFVEELLTGQTQGRKTQTTEQEHE